MEKLNELGLELQELKREMLNTSHSDIIKRALFLSAEDLVKKEVIDVDLHLVLTDEKTNLQNFREKLLNTTECLKTKEELLHEFEKIRELANEKMTEMNILLSTKSLVDTYQISFLKTFKMDKKWVSDYFGQPSEEVDKLMVRNGFVEKFAVLRLSTILENFFEQDQIKKVDKVECKATRVFYDVEEDYYGIHLIFYMKIEDVEDEKIRDQSLHYMSETLNQVNQYIAERLVI